MNSSMLKEWRTWRIGLRSLTAAKADCAKKKNKEVSEQLLKKTVYPPIHIYFCLCACFLRSLFFACYAQSGHWFTDPLPVCGLTVGPVTQWWWRPTSGDRWWWLPWGLAGLPHNIDTVTPALSLVLPLNVNQNKR